MTEISDTIPTLSINPYEDIESLLIQLAKYCIDNNLYRRGNNFHNFKAKDIKMMNQASLIKDPILINGGYFFLDIPNGSEGMIRLYCDDSDPKWSFWIDNGEIKIDWA